MSSGSWPRSREISSERAAFVTHVLGLPEVGQPPLVGAAQGIASLHLLTETGPFLRRIEDHGQPLRSAVHRPPGQPDVGAGAAVDVRVAVEGDVQPLVPAALDQTQIVEVRAVALRALAVVGEVHGNLGAAADLEGLLHGASSPFA